MNFVDIRNQVITSKHSLASSYSEQLSTQLYFNPSELAFKYLYFTHLHEEMHVTFPWSIEHLPLDSYLILYSTHGKAEFIQNSHSYELNENSFLFINCNTTFQLEVSHCNWSFEALYLNGSEINNFYNMFLDDGIPICLDDSSFQIKRLIRKLNKKQAKRSKEEELLQSQTIVELLTYTVMLKMREIQSSAVMPDYIVYMKNIFDHRYHENHTLDSIASEINYNKYKLAKDFKLYTSYSPIDYLIRIRISAAKELLEETRLSISEIGYQVGIENTPHFINLFKKLTGTTPNRYRLYMNCNNVSTAKEL